MTDYEKQVITLLTELCEAKIETDKRMRSYHAKLIIHVALAICASHGIIFIVTDWFL
jgi:hypothetical protein